MTWRAIFSASSRQLRKLKLNGTQGVSANENAAFLVGENGVVRGLWTAASGAGSSRNHGLTPTQSLLQPLPVSTASSMQLTVNYSNGFQRADRAERTYARDVLEYNRVMIQFVERRRTFMLREAYEDMLMDGIAPNRDTFHIAIPGCMRTQRLQDAFYFFNEMKANGLMPDVTLYNCMIPTCGSCIQVDRAFQVAEEMESMGIAPKLRTFVALLNACATAGRVNEAHGVVQRMTVYGLTMNKYCYSALITAYKNRRPTVPDTFTKIMELLEQSKNKGHDDDLSSNQPSGGGGGEDDLEMEEGLFGAQGRRGGGIAKDLIVYHAAIRAMVDLRNYEGALNLVDVIEKEYKRADGFTYYQLVKAHLMAGQLERAMEAFSKYLSATNVPSLDLYVSLIEGAILKFSPEGMAMAKRLLMEFGERGFFLNQKYGGHLLGLAAREFKGDYSVARLIFDMMMKQPNQRPPYAPTLAFLRGLLNRGVTEDDPQLAAARKLVAYRVDQRNNYFGNGPKAQGGKESGGEGEGEGEKTAEGEGQVAGEAGSPPPHEVKEEDEGKVLQ